MKKVGLVTVYGEGNYGNKLQNYALIKIYKDLGYKATTLQVFQSVLIDNFYRKLKRKIKQIISKIPITQFNKFKNEFRRYQKFQQFSYKYLNLSKKYTTHNFDVSEFSKYDLLSIGSDQVWNDIDFDIKDVLYYSLHDVKNIPIVTFAASLGKNEFSNKYVNHFFESFEKYSLITCRENSGTNYISQNVSKKAYTFLDPTLFLSKEEWQLIEKRPIWLKSEKFSIAYFLGGYDKKNIDDNNLIIDLLDKNNIFYTASPEEFIYLIHNAEIIYTDSFHACVFSLIFEKNFKVFERVKQKSNMSSRIETLFSTFNISLKYGKIISKTNYKEFNKKLEKIKNDNLKILKQTLKNLEK